MITYKCASKSFGTITYAISKYQAAPEDVGFGLDLFNDDTHPSGHIGRPTQ